MRNDWETPPTVDGVIVRAWIGEDGQPDVMHVQGVDVADDIGNLDGVLGIFRPKTTKCSGGHAVRGLQRGITFLALHIASHNKSIT